MEFNLQLSIQILERTPQVLSVLLENLSEGWIHNNEGQDTWSPYDIIGHLIHGEQTDWIPRAKIILAQDPSNLTFTPFDRFAQFEESKGKTIDDLLATFANLRKQNIEELEALNISQSQFKLKGMHPELGEVTLAQLLATWVTHDLGHINQIARVMGKNYKDQVGPWTQYIKILRE